MLSRIFGIVETFFSVIFVYYIFFFCTLKRKIRFFNLCWFKSEAYFNACSFLNSHTFMEKKFEIIINLYFECYT